MYWTQNENPIAVWTANELAYHLRIDADVIALSQEQDYLSDLQAAAVEFAETSMGSSLLTRTVTAVFNQHDVLFLPRGPVIAISSVEDTNAVITSYETRGHGNAQALCLPHGYTAPLTVVYTAGYGSDGDNVPADIRHAIRAHVALLYEKRQAATDRTITDVPKSLCDFYRLKSRQTPVG